MERKLIQLSDVITDIAAGPFGSNLKVSCFVNDGFPIIDGANLKSFKVTDNITKFVTEEKARSLHRSITKRGDIVVTISGTLGQIAYIPDDSNYEEYLCSQRQFRVTFDTTKVYVPYLVFYFHTYEGKHKILSFANQVGVPALSQPLKNFRQISVQLPTLETQKKIASIVESINGKIEQNEIINNNLEQQAMALFKSWFIDFEPFDRQVPKTWINGVLGDFVEIKRGGSPRPIQNFLSDSGFHWLKISDATGITSPFINEIKEYIIEAGLKKTVYLKSGSLVLSNSATPGLPKILDIDTCIHDGWLYFPSSKFSNEYLYLYFKHIRDNLIALGNGSVFTNLKTDILKNYPTYLPTEDVLKKFDGLVQPIFSMILSKTREIKRLAEIRDTLLPKLMSGELDVSDTEL
ncbi:restriction endonuclease subunit S [Novisyntrophococcus fermenticellae]|nr:restriction endonuclease subunit S [Novisyntrophococcus fermenticellae]